MNYRITASLVLYNNSEKQIIKLLNSIPLDLVKLVVVDNSTTNFFSRLFEGKYNVVYYFNNKNVGFGKGHNIGYGIVADFSDFHLIINPDVYFDEGMIIKMANYMYDNKNIGVLGPTILYPNGDVQHSCRLLPAPIDLIIRRLPIRLINEMHNKKHEMHFIMHDRVIDVPFLLGCFLFFRSDVFKKIDGFDERYFMYMEDTDICRKVMETHRVVYFPFATIYHSYAKGSAHNFRLLKIHLFSAIKYFNKWGWLFDNKRKTINALGRLCK